MHINKVKPTFCNYYTKLNFTMVSSKKKVRGTNNLIKELFSGTKVIGVRKAQTLTWGIERMLETRILKMLMARTQ